MRRYLLTGLAVAAVMMAPAAWAQSDNEALNRANKGAATTCFDFMEMDSTSQTNILKQLAGGAGGNISTTDKQTGGGDPGGGDFRVQSVVAECRNNPQSTVGDAIKKGSGGTSQGQTGTSPKTPG